MGWSLNGSCRKDAAEVVAQFTNLYPQVESSALAELISVSVSPSGQLSYSVRVDDLTSNTTRNNSATVQLPSCDYSDITLGADYGFSVFIGCSLMFALGFIGTR